MRERVRQAFDPDGHPLFGLLRAVLDDQDFLTAAQYARCELAQALAELATEIETGQEIDLHDILKPTPEVLERFLEVCERGPHIPPVADGLPESLVARMVAVLAELAVDALRGEWRLRIERFPP